jgi:peptide-methionine (S)-S-oxide reductase
MLVFVAAGGFGAGRPEIAPAGPATEAAAVEEGLETAVLAGGCFWGVEAVYERLEGVLDVVSGYAGGDAETARYDMVSSGKSDHAESVHIVYNPESISFETLLKVFFNVAHNPTQLNFQGPDIGTQYRSAVFYVTDEQKLATERYIKELEEKKVFDNPIVTKVVPLKSFFPAEDYHQNFMRLNPNHPYILYWDVPKITHLEKEYPELLEDR